MDILDNDGDYGYISYVETEHIHLLFEDDETISFVFNVFPTRLPMGKVSLNIVSQSDDQQEPYMVLCPNFECKENTTRAVSLVFEDSVMTPQVVQVKYNPLAVPLNVTDATLAILSVVETAEELTGDENFRRTEQSLIPINVKLIPSKETVEAKSITVVEHEPETVVAEGPNGFDAKYDIYLRPCTPEMKNETFLDISQSVPDQVVVDKQILNGPDWGKDCKVTVTVSAVDEAIAKEEGDHFVTLSHVAYNSTGQQILLSDGYPLFVRNVLVRIYDDDIAGVMIDRPLGYVATAEIRESDLTDGKAASIDSSYYESEYRLRLSKAPNGTVSVTVRNEPTATDRETPSTAALNRNYTERDQVLVNGKNSITLKFNESNWYIWQIVTVAAADDEIEEGVDLLYFPSQPSFLSYIQGPISIFGGGAAVIPDIEPPLKLPGEFDEPEFVRPCGAPEANNGTLNVVDANQVDYLIINNVDVRGSLPTTGVLTSSQLTGMNMGRNIVIGGVPQLDGIYYEEMEVIEIYLGDGSDEVLVQNTSAAVHVLNLGDGDGDVLIQEISGPFIGTYSS